LRKISLISVSLLCIVALLTSLVFAWSDMILGKPKIVQGKDKGVFFWLDKDGLHLRFTGPKKHTFEGKLETPESITITRKVGIDKSDTFRKKDNKIIEYRIVTDREIKGFDFKTKSKYIDFYQINMDGKRVLRKNFRSGKKKVELEHTPFRLYDIGNPGTKMPFPH